MRWQDRAEALRERFDEPVRCAIVAVFRELVPDREDVGRTLARVFEELGRRRRGASRVPAFPCSDSARLDEVFEMLEGPLGDLCERVATGTRLGLVARAVAKSPVLRAAQARLRELASDGLRPFPPRRRDNRLENLPLEEGMLLGCWRVWESSSGIGVLLWHEASGRLVRVWTGSNGWWEYRGGGMPKGQVHIVWSAGSTSVKSDEQYAHIDRPPGPCWTFPPGAYVAQDWRFTAGKCELLIAHGPTRRVITLGLGAPLLRCNDAALPGVE